MQTIMKVTMILTLMAAGGGCSFSKPTPDKLVPAIKVANNQRMEGSVNVQAVVFESILSYWIENGTLRVALEKAITKNGLFSEIKQGNADYVLDVWVEKREGVGFMFDDHRVDITSIWRLTKIKDGKVLVCDYAYGHSTSYAVGIHGNRLAMEAATREMIQNGLLILSDRSTRHLSAMSTAGNRPSMGDVVPEGLKAAEETKNPQLSDTVKGITK
jgi:hypothetical protein